MKKNRFLRAASGLLVAVLISTCAISGTYAKYVTDGSVSDTARVADFGVVVNASGTLYSSAYVYNGNTPTTASAGVSSGYATVKYAGSAGDNLVAPGTQSYGDGLTFGVSGTPEVSVEITAEITAEDIYLGTGSWAVMTDVTSTVSAANFGTYTLYTEDSGTYTQVDSTDTYDDTETYYQITDSATVDANYFPVVYTLTNDNGWSADDTAMQCAVYVASFINGDGTQYYTISNTGEYKREITNISRDFAANTDLANDGKSAGLGGLNLTWEWDFDNSGAGTNDAWDTILGDLIAQKNQTMVDGVVVYNSATSGTVTSYEAVDFDDYAVTISSGATTVAYLQTSFSIDLAVTQID